MSNSPHLTAPYLVEGQSQGEVTHNDGLNYIETLLCGKIKDRDLTTPPGSPANGDAYIVGAAATGAWSTHDGKIAAYYSGWIFITPKESFHIFIEDEDKFLIYIGSAWREVPVVDTGGNLALVGKNYVGDTQTIADDAAYSFVPGKTTGVLLIFGRTDANKNFWAIVVYACTGTEFTVKAAGGTDVNVTTGQLTGTTGTDAKLTVSARTSDTKLYIENRTGASGSWGLVLLGS